LLPVHFWRVRSEFSFSVEGPLYTVVNSSVSKAFRTSDGFQIPIGEKLGVLWRWEDDRHVLGLGSLWNLVAMSAVAARHEMSKNNQVAVANAWLLPTMASGWMMVHNPLVSCDVRPWRFAGRFVIEYGFSLIWVHCGVSLTVRRGEQRSGAARANGAQQLSRS